MDEDLEALSREELLAEVKKLRAAIREHRDSSGHDLCWHHPNLWSLLPEKVTPEIAVPDWPQFLSGCIDTVNRWMSSCLARLAFVKSLRGDNRLVFWTSATALLALLGLSRPQSVGYTYFCPLDFGPCYLLWWYSDTNLRRRGEEVPMQRIVRAFPLLPGKEKALQELTSQLAGERAEEAVEFFGRFGVTHESWHAQETPAGTWVIGVTEISDIPVEVAAEGYARSEKPFDSWFKEQVREITGIDPNTKPLGPPTQCIFNWSR